MKTTKTSRLAMSIVLVTAVLGLIGCGGGGGGGGALGPVPGGVLTGVFVDEPVQGLTFLSGAQTGSTDAAGLFKFETAGTVQFNIGNIVIGAAPGKALITPVDLVKNVDPAATATDPRVIQITRFLMTLDSTPTATTMTIPIQVITAAQGEAPVDLSRAVVDIVPILARLAPAKTPVTVAAATAHIQATLAALGAPKAGAYAAVDSTTAPTLGISMTAVSNPVGNAFDVTGEAVSMHGETWDVLGTLTTDGSLLATGTGTGTPPPADMTITGAMSSATQIAASASFTLGTVPKTVSLTFEKAVAPTVTGNFALPNDPGVTSVAPPQTQHVAAEMKILVDGTVSTNLVEVLYTGAPPAVVLGTRFANLTGVVTSTNNVIAVGGTPGTPGTPGAGETILARSIGPSPAVILTGTVNLAGPPVSAKVTGLDLTGAGVIIPPLSFSTQTNTFAGVYAGTHTDTAPGLPSTWTFGVNNDGSVHGYAKFLRQRPTLVQETDFSLNGIETAGVLGVGAVPNPLPGTLTPGLVMIDDEGTTNLTPGTFDGTIAAGAVNGNWATGPAPLTTGTFTGNLLP